MRTMGAKAIVLGLGIAFLALPAFAQEASTSAPADSVPATPAEVAASPTTASVPSDAPAPAPEKSEPAFSLDDLTTYGTLGLGGSSGDSSVAPGQTGIFNAQAGVRFGPYFGLEAEGGTSIPGDSRSSKKLSLTDRYAAYIVGYLPWTKHFDLFAKLGLGHSRYKYEDNGASLSTDLDSVNWGVGAQYLFNDHDGVRTEVLKENYHDSRGDRTSLMFSWIHRF
jgi:outer membrane immunogenic protein